jgi:cobalamin biosynthetic protein CobC
MTADLGSGPKIVHGGRLTSARHAFPDAPAPFLDLSTGISPYAYPFRSLPERVYNRLPEPEQEEALRCLAASTYGAPGPTYVALAPGSQMLISLLPGLLGCRSAAVLGPTYAEHRASWHRAGAAVVDATSLTEFAGAAAPSSVLVLCNPNNPDGRILDRMALSGLADHCLATGAMLVVDEAYADLEQDTPAAAGLLAGNDRIIVLRSFGKSYGLAGLRLGMLLAAPEIASAMRALLGPWPVGGPAIAIGCQALADRNWRDRVAKRTLEQSSRLARLLDEAGLEGIGGTRLFRLARSNWAAGIWRELAEAGLLVRRFDEQPTWLRFGLPPDETGWRRLAAAFRGTLAPGCLR